MLNLKKVLSAAMVRLKEHADLVVGLANVDESTFRSFFLAELMVLHPDARCQTEWRRYDLLVQCHDETVLVEFKFYVYRTSCALNGTRPAPKGGPGPKNESEFRACVEKLHNASRREFSTKCLVLVYERLQPEGRIRSYERSYGDIQTGAAIETVATIAHPFADALACKLIVVR